MGDMSKEVKVISWEKSSKWSKHVMFKLGRLAGWKLVELVSEDDDSFSFGTSIAAAPQYLAPRDNLMNFGAYLRIHEEIQPIHLMETKFHAKIDEIKEGVVQEMETKFNEKI